MSSKEGDSQAEVEELVVKDTTDLLAKETLLDSASEDLCLVTKERKKKNKHHRSEKRKRSCSVDSVSSTSSHKRHKKKKKKKSKEEPHSPKVNPIFLWVKQDHTKIVEVLCEDYDKRNRIKLTKTPGGWVAIPRTNMFCPEAPKETSSCKKEEEVEDVKPLKVELKEEVLPILPEAPCPAKNELLGDPFEDKALEMLKEPECTEVKCCPEVNLDENHNNEVEPPSECVEFHKKLEDDVDDMKVSDNVEEHESILIPDDDEESPEAQQDNCVNLMNELADLCFPDSLKDDSEPKDLHDIYTFVPSPAALEKEEVEAPALKDLEEVKKPPTPEPVLEPTPINLVVHPERDLPEVEQTAEEGKEPKMEELKQSDLDSLDILWRLPEGTTICTSKPLPETKPAAPQEKTPQTFSQPVQEEPLNLGKPKPKEEKKPEKQDKDSKLLELLKPDDKTQSNPLDQLKEVLSDPDLTVPDPLLVPRARLGALIANPAKEIPKLLAQKREVKYPKLDPDLMVVSLAHLQSILQKSGKEDELRLYQQQMMTSYEKMDPTAAALNQMLWLPYLSQLEATHNQELMAMLYPTYVHPSYFSPAVAAPTAAARYPYPRPAWPRPESSKPLLQHAARSHHHKSQTVPKHQPMVPKLKPVPKMQPIPKLHSPPVSKMHSQGVAKLHSPPVPKMYPISAPKLNSSPIPKIQSPSMQRMQSPPMQRMQSPPMQGMHSPPMQRMQSPTDHKSREPLQQAAKPKLKVRDNLIDPKLKVRDNLVEGNPRTDLLKFDPTNPFLPGVGGVPPNTNLWHPLFSR